MTASLHYIDTTRQREADAREPIDTARGVLYGVAVSLAFWVLLAWAVLR